MSFKIFHPRHSSTPRLDRNNRFIQLDANRNFDLNNTGSLNLTTSLSGQKMADYDTIHKALRLLPDFDGNPNVLPRFIKLCDQFVEEFAAAEASLSSIALINGILNKVTGPAARLINSNGIPENWPGIRNALINNFSDQRDETALYNDLALLTQGSLTPQEYYEKCQNMFSAVMTYIVLHETIESTVESKRTLYKKLTLQSFLRGLKDPLGARIRCMRPETIEKALEFIHEEQNTLYMQQRNSVVEHSTERKLLNLPLNQPPKFPMQPNPFSSKPFMVNTPVPGPSRFNSNFNAPMLKPVYNQQGQNFQYHGPSRTQQMFSAPLPSHPRNNAFAMPQRNVPAQPSNNGPRPMSGVSHFVSKALPPTGMQGHNWAMHGNPRPTNYFKSREMHFNECYDNQFQFEPYDYYSDYYYAHNPEYFYEESCDNPQVAYLDQYPANSCEEPEETPIPIQENFQKLPKSDKPK